MLTKVVQLFTLSKFFYIGLFLKGGHLYTQENSSPLHWSKCLAAAKSIYAYVRAYRNTFTLRRAPYLLTYALFSAAAIFLLDAGGHRVAIQFCYEALNEVIMPNYGFRRPVKIMRNLINQLERQSDSSTDAYLSQSQITMGQPLWSNERASASANEAIREPLANTQMLLNFETALRREGFDRNNDILGSSAFQGSKGRTKRWTYI